jgi:hypothetical protein
LDFLYDNYETSFSLYDEKGIGSFRIYLQVIKKMYKIDTFYKFNPNELYICCTSKRLKVSCLDERLEVLSISNVKFIEKITLLIDLEIFLCKFFYTHNFPKTEVFLHQI